MELQGRAPLMELQGRPPKIIRRPEHQTLATLLPLGNEVGTRGLADDVPKFLYHILVAIPSALVAGKKNVQLLAAGSLVGFYHILVAGTCALVAHKTMFSCWPLVVL